MIKVTNLNKYYNKGRSNELHVINETCLTLDDTGLVCILGESGSGKTTLMNTISGLDDFVNGTIEVDDRTITKYGSAEQEIVRNEKFGYIFQNYYLLQDRTVEYNIKIALSLYDISDEEKEERIDYVLKAVDMSRYKRRPVSQLSGGQQQRIAIARALAKTPRVIFADEPTGNLDEANTMKIMSILKKLSKDCLVVVVTHERTIADFFADRIIWISDGKIVKESTKTTQGTYQFVDDTNIYLQEFEKKDYTADGIKIETYTNPEEQIDLEFKLIYENGKIYFYTENPGNIEFITADNEKKVIDGKRPSMEIDEIDNLEYSLGKIESSKKPKMGFGEVCKLAFSNLRNMGKKQVFLVISLIAMAVLIVLSVQDIMSVLTVDKQGVVQTDSHFLQITMAKGGLISNDDYREAMKSLMDEVNEANLKGSPYVVPTLYLGYDYEGFWQMEDVTNTIENFSLVPLDHLSESDLIYGEMPNEPNEIVVDKWILENFITGATEFSNIITSVTHFLGKTFTATNTRTGVVLTIVGIADTNEPSIYIDKFQGLGISSWGRTTMSLTQLNAATDGKYSDVTLADGEILVPESLYQSYIDEYLEKNYPRFMDIYLGEVRLRWGETYEEWYAQAVESYGMTYDDFIELMDKPEEMTLTLTTTYNSEYVIKGYFEDLYGMEMVVPEEAYNTIVKDINAYRRTFYIYTDDKASIEDFIANDVSSSITRQIDITVTDIYENEMREYNESRSVKIDARMLITIVIFLITMIILYFMMKANAVKRMTDIGVYRLLGISKGTIVGLFAMENVYLTTCTSVVGASLTALVTKFISSIPALGMTFIYPWYAFVGTILFFYIVNTLVGVIPILRILKLPPAQLASKYDI